MIEPISSKQQIQVIDLTNHYIRRASDIYQRPFESIPVLFDLRGRASGMFRIKNGLRQIRYNPWLFAKYYQSNLEETVPHEVAHYITERLHGLRSVRPHGEQWCSVMRDFGAEPSRTNNYDMAGIPVRQYHSYQYRCGCTDHQFTKRRHNKVTNGRARYFCRRCGDQVLPCL